MRRRRSCKHRGTRRSIKGHYFGPFASGRGGAPDADHLAAKGLPAALLFRRAFTRARTRPCHAASDQALRGPLYPRLIALERLCQGLVDEARQGFLSRQDQRPSSYPPRRRADERGGLRSDMDFERAARAARSPQCPRLDRPGDGGDINARHTVEEADIFAVAFRRWPILRTGVLFPRLPELGQSRAYFRPRRQDASLSEGDSAWRRSWASSTKTSRIPPRQVLISARAVGLRARADGRSPLRSEVRPTRLRCCVPKRGEKRQTSSTYALTTTPAKRLAASSPRVPRNRNYWLEGVAEMFGLEASAGAASRSTTTPTSWAPTPSAAMIVAGPKTGFSEKALPHLQHPHRPTSPPATTLA